MKFGDKVRKYRLENGWEIEDLARKTGLSVSAIKLYEYGKRRNPLNVAKTALAAAFQIPPSMLDDDDDRPEVPIIESIKRRNNHGTT